jgi:thioredoxin reductase (NADPH)
MLTLVDDVFPKLSTEEIAHLASLSVRREYADGEAVFTAGDKDVELIVVESGTIDVLNPCDNNAVIVTLKYGQFSGNIDLLFRRTYVVTGIARGATSVLRVPNQRLSEVLLKIPLLSEKLIIAFEKRTEILLRSPKLGLKIIGPKKCKHTTVLRQFLHCNFVPFTWYELDSEEGRELHASLGSLPVPVVECFGKVLTKPSVHELADCSGILRHYSDRTIDFAICGAGPAGLTAAVYGASEGLSTLVLDSLGPGGQTGGTSRIENFIGFPAGLSGHDFALRGTLQMLKFGAGLYAPVTVKTLEPATDGSGYHRLVLECGTVVQAKTVLIATGMRWRKFEGQNAERFERNGIYYACTTIEAVLYDQAHVGVIGGGNSAGQAATYLAECCPKRTVHLFVRSQLGLSMSQYLVDRCRSMPNIHIHEETTVTAVHGGDFIEEVEIIDHGVNSRLPVSALFVFIGAEPCVDWVPSCVARNEKGFLLTGAETLRAGKWPLENRAPCPLETSIPGILAAGDVRSGSTKRVGFAVGDGAQSVACVHELLATATRG